MRNIILLALSFMFCATAFAQPKGTSFHNLYVQKDTPVLFWNLPNPIDIHVPHVKASTIKLKCADSDLVIYRSMAHGDTMGFVIYSHTKKVSKTIDLIAGGKVYKIHFAICPPPALVLRLGNVKRNEATVTELMTEDKLTVGFADPAWGNEYPSQVNRFVLVTNANGNITNTQGWGNTLSDAMKDIIKALPPGASISFEEVGRNYPPYDIGNAPEILKIFIRQQ